MGDLFTHILLLFLWGVNRSKESNVKGEVLRKIIWRKERWKIDIEVRRMVELLWEEFKKRHDKVWLMLSHIEGRERENGEEGTTVLEEKRVWGEGIAIDREIIWRNMRL